MLVQETKYVSGLRTLARIQSDTPKRREKEADISSEQVPGTETVCSMPRKQQRESGKKKVVENTYGVTWRPCAGSRPEDTVELGPV